MSIALAGSDDPINLVLAVVSPNGDVYSETFIQAHRLFLSGRVCYYYGGMLPRFLHGQGPLQDYSIPARLSSRIRRWLQHRHLSSAQLAVADSLRQQGVQVVIAEYGPTGVQMWPICRLLRVPLIVHFHGYDASMSSVIESYREAYRQMFTYATSVIAVSHAMEQRLLELGCPRQKLIYNVYGPSDDFFSIHPAVSPPPRLLAVGRFVPKKAPHCTLLAFRRVVERFPNAVLTMGGTGPLWEACSDLVNYFGLADNVVLPGVLSPEQVREHMANACAFVQYSVTAQDGDMEGTPVAVLEAQAAGLPVVATRHAGIPDVVVDGETGWLVDEHDIERMAERMCSLLAQPEQARTMGEAGRRRVREHFTMKRSIEGLDRCVADAFLGTRD